ncbi:Terminase [Pseudomonas sp. OF001]|uniref:phage terminase small subunit n=1 Tax=unclassified Pseudomonas TaxID=196821 RepID=UPI0010A68454|nr:MULTISPECIES: phage terminase small subunit [unclassified Pseudomonas]THG81500.1 terminase [Pseudomonas sp. A-1]CAD5379006.1 Terminase [Pseudomonas sp. OF001]
MSLALAHKRRLLAERAAGKAPGKAEAYTPATALAGPANAQKHLKLMESALAEDLARIADINSREARQQLKRDELLPKYLPYVERYRESGLNHPNPVLMQVLVWLFDTAQFEQGLELAEFAIAQGQQLPERFKRDVQTFVADEVIEWAEAEHKAGRNPEPYVSILLPRVDGSWDGFATGGDIERAPGWELFERIPARFHKLLGIIALEREEWAKAISHFDRATELYPEIGVGTRRAQADKALRRQGADTAQGE